MSSPPPADSGVPGADEKPRLTEEEKKQNHIASEQKRRQAIREGFDRLTELVPGLEGQGRSEGLVLKRTVEFMREKIEERRDLVDRVEKAGGEVNEELKR
ncbi:Transcription factor [Amphichorda felina]